ncbi:MAG: cyclic nucleotide-binding domain-containing protein [Candidatus Cloacimonetes bacterium]|nr:cyclic nucleotide-binding domain-containing protein [Candidatus Cloacimonadota bacterium]
MGNNIFKIVEQLELSNENDALSFISRYAKKKQYRANEILVKEGERAQKVYIILAGEAMVFKYDHMGNIIELASITQGNLFGEMAIFLDKKRTASIKAKTDLIVAEFGSIDFIKALANNPDLVFRVFSNFVDNVNEMNEKISILSDMLLFKTLGFYLFNISKGQEIIPVNVNELCLATKITEVQLSESIKEMHNLKLIESYKIISKNQVDISINKELMMSFLLTCKS